MRKKYDPLARERRGDRCDILFSKQLPLILTMREREGLACLQEISYIVLYSFCEADWETNACRSGLGLALLLTQMQVVRKFLRHNRIILVGKLMKVTGSLFLKRATFQKGEH